VSSRRSLLRGAAVLALATAFIGASTIAPIASASTLDNLGSTDAVYSTMNKPKTNDDDGGGSPLEGAGIGDIPIIGDVVGGLQDAEPEEIISGAVQFAGVAAETVVPLIRGLIK
jgi:hypothetical protein